MRITFDPAKRDITLRQRGIDFGEDALRVLTGRVLHFAGRREDYGEFRVQTIGHLEGRMMMVVWTPRDGARHIISMRKCNDREQARYSARLSEKA